jgi:hypothetical protein
LPAYALPLIDELDSLPTAAHWGEWLDCLGTLATRTLKQPDRVLAILAELAPMAPVGPAELNEVLNVLRSLLLETAVPPPAQRYGKVFVGPIDTARGLTFDAVFVPGLAEKMFPRKIVEEPILLDSARMQSRAILPPTRRALDASASRWPSRPAQRSVEYFSRIPASISVKRGRGYPPFTRWRPCGRPKAAFLILPSLRGVPRQRQPPGSGGRRRPIPTLPLTTQSTISPSSTASWPCPTKARAVRATS